MLCIFKGVCLCVLMPNLGLTSTFPLLPDLLICAYIKYTQLNYIYVGEDVLLINKKVLILLIEYTGDYITVGVKLCR